MSRLHRRLAALLALIALIAFAAGAGIATPGILPAGVLLVLAIFVQPRDATSQRLEPFWRLGAVLLAARAGFAVFVEGSDPVLPMVDLLLLLLCAESLRLRDGSGDARHFALTFALLIASAAYRPGPAFGILFTAYVVCAMLVLVLGHVSRQATARGTVVPPPRPRFLLRIALLSTVVLAVSGAVFVFFPRLPQGPGSRGGSIGGAVVGFSDRVSIGSHGARIEPNPEVVMRVEFPGGAPRNVHQLRWRGRAYDRFDGWTWRRSGGAPQPPTEALTWPGPIIEQIIYARHISDANVIFGLHPILDVTPLAALRIRRVSHGDYTYVGDADPTYRVRSRAAAPSASVLAQVEMDSAADATLDARLGRNPDVARYLQLPPLSGRTLALADSLRRISPTLLDHVAGIEYWLRTEFRYTLDLPASRREATLDHFLFERRAGHCEYFSTAMAMLLRAGGVPARNVNGFLGGDWNEYGGFLTVTQNHAHSWVEVWFPGVGWVTFDPTPAGVGELGDAGAVAGWLRPLFLVVQGLEHRWGKWVLDYDLGIQSSLLRRLADPLSGDDRRGEEARGAARRLWPPLALLALLALAARIAWRRVRTGASPASAESRAYLALRRTYQKAGLLPAGAVTPLFVRDRLAAAPGGGDAARAVELYVQARFGGRPLGTAERAELDRRVGAARRAVRQAGRQTRTSPPSH